MKIGVDDQASDKIKSITGKLGNGLKTAAKVGTAAVGVASTAIVGLTKQAVENYAEYEQLVGGVDTLFKNASQKVQQYAAEAYRTSGMSANDYMANATAFSASLISALGGDTEKAAEYANRAMVSMSDNANKMGTSLDSIVQTYQSLSRGNMAMLDNLKLGYGGTKAELERLIKDASTYTDIQKEMGITVDASSMSFDNIVNAIAVVQGKLGIAGATAQEAGTTIEGSVNSMKAAWQNLITGVADKNADLEGLINNLVTTIVGDGTENNLGVLGNIMPAVKQALNGASRLVSEMIPIIIKEVPPVITENLPILATAAVSIVQALIDGISSNDDLLVGSAFEVVKILSEGILGLLPQVVQLGLDLLVSLANGIAQNLPTLIPTIVGVVLQIVETLTKPENLNNLLTAALEIVTQLAWGLIDAIPQLIDSVFIIVDNIVDFLTDPVNLGKLIGAAIELVIAIGVGIIKALPNLLTDVFALLVSVGDAFKNFDWASLGTNLVQGFRNGISEAWGNLKSWFSNLFGDLIGIAERILGIASPSKVFEKIGLFTDEGLQGGLERGARNVFKTVEKLSKGVTESFNPDLTADYTVSYNNSSIGRSNSFVQPFGQIDSYGQKTKVVVSIDDNVNPLSFARYLLPFLKVAQKEVYG